MPTSESTKRAAVENDDLIANALTQRRSGILLVVALLREPAEQISQRQYRQVQHRVGHIENDTHHLHHANDFFRHSIDDANRAHEASSGERQMILWRTIGSRRGMNDT